MQHFVKAEFAQNHLRALYSEESCCIQVKIEKERVILNFTVRKPSVYCH